MKSIIILFAVLLFTGCSNVEDNLSSRGNDKNMNKEGDIPTTVTDAFKAKYSGASDAEWEMDGDVYEVEFMMNGEEWEAEFNADGEWIMTEQEIDLADLPEIIKSSIEEAYPGAEIEEAESLEHAEYGNIFEVEIKVDGKEIEIFIDNEGNILGEDQEDESYEEEDDGDE